MNFRGQDWRDRRGLLNQGMTFPTMHYTIANYCTDHKSELNTPFTQEDILNKLHSIPDPLKKNLADSVISFEENNKKNKDMPPDTKEYYYETDMTAEPVDNPPSDNKNESYPSLAGITTFFSNFFGAISGAMFQKRAKSPVRYYDCFDQPDSRERSPPPWQSSKFDDQNKNGAPELRADVLIDNMNKNCRDAVSQCEGKLNAVRNLLLSKSAPVKPKYRRRPRKLFVEPGSVEDRFEDAFAPEDYTSLANEEYVEYFSVKRVQKQDLCEVDSPKMKTEIGPVQEHDIVKVLPVNEEKIVPTSATEERTVPMTVIIKEEIVPTSTIEVITVPTTVLKEEIVPTHVKKETVPEETKIVSKTEVIDQNTVQNSMAAVEPVEVKPEIILTCEDKMAKLKSLLQEKRQKNTKTVPDLTDSAVELVKDIERPMRPSKSIPIDKVKDKRFKNPNRMSTDKRKHSKLRKNIQDDMLFANEIDSENLSLNNSPISVSTIPEALEEKDIDEKEYFDEVRGRFQSSSATDSEDSFQIVFSDSPKLPRSRKPSDCDSDDSFIVFEDSPDSCYTSNDVFGDESDSGTDSDSDVDDSGVSEVCNLPHTFSRTVSDLTDDSLYEEVKKCDKDEVDCAVRTLEEIPQVLDVPEVVEDHVKPGLLLNEARKLQRKEQPSKSVTFSSKPPKVHVMRVWTFAARQARAGHWERHALDRERFKRRIADIDMAVSWVLKPQHRKRVMFQRFMPWWNALRRKEIAEKKQKEAEEKLQREKDELERLRKEVEAKELELEVLEKHETVINGIVNGAEDTSINNEDDVKKKTKVDVKKKNKAPVKKYKQLILLNDKLVGMKLDSGVIKETI